MPVEDCIRCGAAPGVDEQGYCGHCHWAVKVEIQEGFHQLRDYLAGLGAIRRLVHNRCYCQPDRLVPGSRSRSLTSSHRFARRGALSATSSSTDPLGSLSKADRCLPTGDHQHP